MSIEKVNPWRRGVVIAIALGCAFMGINFVEMIRLVIFGCESPTFISVFIDTFVVAVCALGVLAVELHEYDNRVEAAKFTAKIEKLNAIHADHTVVDDGKEQWIITNNGMQQL